MTEKVASCPACLSARSEMVESVSIDSLAAAWSRENCLGENAGADAVRAFICADWKAEVVGRAPAGVV